MSTKHVYVWGKSKTESCTVEEFEQLPKGKWPLPGLSSPKAKWVTLPYLSRRLAAESWSGKATELCRSHWPNNTASRHGHHLQLHQKEVMADITVPWEQCMQSTRSWLRVAAGKVGPPTMTMSRWGTKALLENDFASSLNKLGRVGLAKKNHKGSLEVNCWGLMTPQVDSSVQKLYDSISVNFSLMQTMVYVHVHYKLCRYNLLFSPSPP